MQNIESLATWIASDPHIMPLDGKSIKDLVDSSVELTKANGYDFLLPWLGTGLLTSTDDKWRSRRKMLTPTFHFRMLDGYQETFNAQCKRLVDILNSKADESSSDLFPFIKRCALDIICEAAMGTTVDAQSNHDHPYVEAVNDMSKLAIIHATKPWYHFSPLFYAVGYGRRRDVALKMLTDFTKKVIAERKEAKKASKANTSEHGRVAFLDMLIDFAADSKLNDEDIREEVDTFMFEGHDTTSSGIAFTLWSLACHPEIQERVAAELFSIFGNSDREVTKEDLGEMKYLEMCIKESLRLFPPVPMVQRRIVHGDLKIAGKVVPKGASCAICSLAVHHNKKLYPNAEDYEPDNFLPENVAKRHPYDYIPFSAGPRNCIGQKFATNEEKTMVSWVLRRFKLEATMPFKKNRAGLQMTLVPEQGVPVRLTRRVFNE